MENIKVFMQRYAIHHFGIDLLHLSDAIELIDLCQAADIPVLGIDAFRLCDDCIQPFLEHSADFSHANVSYQEIREFLASKRQHNLIFEIVI